MARLRVTASQKRHLADARVATGMARRGGVMIVPGIASIEDWEREAMASQAKLIAEARDDPRYAIEEPPPPMTAKQERDFQHSLPASRYLGLTDEERAARAAKAIGLIR
jgi:hypothetical protein